MPDETPTRAQIESVILDASIVTAGDMAGVIESLFCPHMAELAALRLERASVRRAALLEAVNALCPHCQKGVPVQKDKSGVLLHGSGRGVPFCRAPEIHALLAQEQAQGEGGGDASL